MAGKTILKCFYCGQPFDRTKEEHIKVNGNRYAHQICYDKRTEEDIAKDKIYKKTAHWFGADFQKQKIDRQLNKYIKEGKNVQDILKALEYFFEVKENDPSKANGGIGIVPHVYEESIAYWNSLNVLKESMKKGIEKQEERVIEVKRRPISKPVNLAFFDIR